MPELTEEEKKNGWTEEKLEKYLLDRAKAQTQTVLDRPPVRPRWANNSYSPLKW